MKIRYLLLLMVFLLIGCSNKSMVLPQSETITSVKIFEVSTPSGIAVKEDPKDIQRILDQFRSAKSTNEKSVNDSPMNADGVIRIDFVHTDSNATSRLFIYHKEDKYFAEQPYTGIWQISREVYEGFAMLAKEGDVPRALMVDGKLFLDTGEAVSTLPNNKASDGMIRSMVMGDQFPEENDQSNFGSEIPYYYDGETLVYAMINSKWILFEIL